MKNVMNIHNSNNMTGKYPIFLGDDLGFADEINITYQDIYDVFQEHQSQYWLPSEFHFNSDRIDLMEAPKSERDVMVLNLLAQWLMDSVASRSIIEIFGPITSNEEAHSWFLTQSFFEQIHAATYSKIIRNCFTDANAILEEGKANLDVFNRTKVIGEMFNNLINLVSKYQLGEDVNEREMKKGVLKGLFTLFCLEQISFMASFSATFALVETGRYQNIGKAVGSIAADEVLHAKGDQIVLNNLLADPEYQDIFQEVKGDIQSLIDSVVKQEMDWSEYIFQDGRKVLGLNETLLKEYVAYVALPVYEEYGFDWPEFCGEKPRSNPLPYMDKYLDRDMVQTANQEITNNSYRVGQVVNDLDDNDFDIDF